eukprot:357339-Chlamydomonas_euryale.AAC.1
MPACAQVALWGISRSVSGASAARAHLAGLLRELSAGRTSIALVLAREMAALMDVSTSGGGNGGGGGGPAPTGSPGIFLPGSGDGSGGMAPAALDASKVAADVRAARRVLSDAAAAAKTAEAMLAA